MVCTVSQSLYECDLRGGRGRRKKALKEALTAEEYEMVTAASDFKNKMVFLRRQGEGREDTWRQSKMT